MIPYTVSNDPEDALEVRDVKILTSLRTVLFAGDVKVGESADPALWNRNLCAILLEKPAEPACAECAGPVDSHGYCDPCAERAVAAECERRGVTRDRYAVEAFILADRPDAK